MSDQIREPAPRPCGSCPYKIDTPSGVWSEHEYDKLPDFDRETGEQPPSVFMCHQQDGRICAGWAGCHDMSENLGLRIAVSCGAMSLDVLRAVENYTTDVPLHPDGATAAAFGKGEIEAPSAAAVKMVRKLDRKQKKQQAAKTGQKGG